MNGEFKRSRKSTQFVFVQRMLVVAACLSAVESFHRYADGATLQQLFNGGFVIAGNSQFTDWKLISLDSTAAVQPDLSRIQVSPLANDNTNPGLQLAGNGQLAITGANSIDLVFQYRVVPRSGGNTFLNHSLRLTSVNFGG